MNKEMYLVIETDFDYSFNVRNAYRSLADAEEAIFTEAEDFAYEVIMAEDPVDVKGSKAWDIPLDSKWLMRDYAECFTIHKVEVID